MGFSYERGAASRNLLRARAQGHEDAIADAEALAHTWLGSDDDGDEMEEYIAAHYADFTPEPPVITDDMVEKAADAAYENLANQDPRWNEVHGDTEFATLDGSFHFLDTIRAALEAALNPPA